MALFYEPKVKCPKCGKKTKTFETVKFGYTLRWIEFCLGCGWFKFVERPRGREALFLQIHGVDATPEELKIINRILKEYEEGAEGTLKI